MTARVFVATMLLLLELISWALGPAWRPLALALVLGYLGVTVLAAMVLTPSPPLRHFGPAWLAAVGFDIATFALLQSLQGTSVNYTPLFALPVLTCAVLGTVPVGLGTTALVTLLLLGDAFWHWAGTDASSAARFVQAALTGTGLFVVALLAHQLALRLAREEAMAARGQSAARMHAHVNDLVIETLGDGVLVIDAIGLVHSANPAAATILGYDLSTLALPFALTGQPAWHPLDALAHKTFMRRTPQTIELPLAQMRGAPLEVRVHTRLTPTGDDGMDSLCVMFVQDLRELEARIRTEKLAAMGRMSAAVAHEIRNPLAAIMQATALLGEDLQEPAHQQLTRMVANNAQRLARIVDDVLDVARVRQQQIPFASQRLQLDATVRSVAEDWVRQSPHLGLLMVLDASDLEVCFDADHLRRILVNLLDNAARYAGSRDGSIQITTGHAESVGPSLSVWSDGSQLEPAVQRHLFEPFFSSESRSSGLGLFICRELCARHGATIEYMRRAVAEGGPQGNEFRLHFALAEPRLAQ